MDALVVIMALGAGAAMAGGVYALLRIRRLLREMARHFSATHHRLIVLSRMPHPVIDLTLLTQRLRLLAARLKEMR